MICSLSLRWWCWGGQSATKARTQQYLDRPPLFLQGIHAKGLDWIEMPLLVLFYYYYYYFFLGFSFWVVGLIDFGLLVVVDLILVVLWLVACDSFGLWACLWWWWFLVVVMGGHERERERDLWCGWFSLGLCSRFVVQLNVLWEIACILDESSYLFSSSIFFFLIIPHFDLVSLCYYAFFFLSLLWEERDTKQRHIYYCF